MDRYRRMARRGIWTLIFVALLGFGTTQCGSVDPPVAPTSATTPLALLLPTSTLTPTPTPQPVLSATPLPTEAPALVAPAATSTPESTAPVMTTPSAEGVPSTQVPLTQAPPAEDAPPPPTATAQSQPPTEVPPTALPTAAPPPTAAPTSRPPLAPQQGGEWDMEGGFAPGSSPLGETCPGWAVANGWAAFVAPGNPASSCLNENKNLDNVHSDQRSQELTFDFINAEAGIYRQAKTIPGHRYRIEAWGKHIRSASPVQLFLGTDPSGGQNWQADSVTWHPWDETQENAWVHTQVVVKAQAEALTLFLKGYHPQAVQGGATLFDDVHVIDLGP